jgi:hypothetical protein
MSTISACHSCTRRERRRCHRRAWKHCLLRMRFRQQTKACERHIRSNSSHEAAWWFDGEKSKWWKTGQRTSNTMHDATIVLTTTSLPSLHLFQISTDVLCAFYYRNKRFKNSSLITPNVGHHRKCSLLLQFGFHQRLTIDLICAHDVFAIWVGLPLVTKDEVII